MYGGDSASGFRDRAPPHFPFVSRPSTPASTLPGNNSSCSRLTRQGLCESPRQLQRQRPLALSGETVRTSRPKPRLEQHCKANRTSLILAPAGCRSHTEHQQSRPRPSSHECRLPWTSARTRGTSSMLASSVGRPLGWRYSEMTTRRYLAGRDSARPASQDAIR